MITNNSIGATDAGRILSKTPQLYFLRWILWTKVGIRDKLLNDLWHSAKKVSLNFTSHAMDAQSIFDKDKVEIAFDIENVKYVIVPQNIFWTLAFKGKFYFDVESGASCVDWHGFKTITPHHELEIPCIEFFDPVNFSSLFVYLRK